ncbi:MAG: hypothetical protein H6558_08490, partial [Lewinellaceae bacterium]|nr:hypothetical protein [Lewinellaceae bacterium]
ESAGSYIHGAAGGEVVKTTTLSAPAAVNPGNIGATITSGQDLGSTTIRRGHPPHTIYGAEGIRRYYDISPANNTGLAATLRLAYLDHELNGIEEAELEAVKKVDPSWHYYTTNTYDLAANYVETDGIDAFNTWTLAPAPIKLMPRAFLQGPYAAGQMNDGLRSGSLIPSTEPYTGLGYAHTGYGGNEAMEPALLNNTGNDAIVDWMIVELRNATDNTQVLHSRASLIQRDGDITGLNGKDPVAFPGAAEGDYYVVLRHRNHLGVMSAGSVSLSSGLANAYDFTSSSAMATGVNPMAEVSAGVWALWGGNANGDGAVRASGPSFINDYSRLLSYLGGATNLVFGAYTREDLNMDGNVRASGPSLINDYSKLLNVLGTSTTIITQGF